MSVAVAPLQDKGKPTSQQDPNHKPMREWRAIRDSVLLAVSFKFSYYFKYKYRV